MKSTRPGDSNNIARDYYDSMLVEMRYIDSDTPSTKMNMFGYTFDSPLSITSISHLGMFGYGENGMVDVAKAAASLNLLNFCGAGSEEELESIIATGAKTVKIVKPFADMELALRGVRHAEKVGAIAVGMDIDHTFDRKGNYSNVDKIPLSPKSLDDLKRLIAATKLPFVVKGILSVKDAMKCLEAGAQGIYVSNHHGLTQFMAPPVMVLPEIVEAVGGKMKIFVDGGIESAYDAFKALALGADAIGVGRAILKTLKNDGEEGVRKWLENTMGELTGVMAHAGVHDLSEMNSSLVRMK